MEEIIIEDIYNKYKIEEFRKALKNPNILLNFATLLINEISWTLINKPEYWYVKLAANIAIYSNITRVIRKSLGPANINEKLKQDVMDTKEYQKLIELYDEYTSLIADLIKKERFDNDMERSIFLEKLTQKGYLSKDKTFQFKAFKYDTESMISLREISGARVATSTGVCRHICSLHNDVLKKCGVDIRILPTHVAHTNHPEYNKHFRNITADHVVLGIIEKGEKYIYDPTNNCFGRSTINHFGNKEHDIDIAELITLGDSIFYNIFIKDERFSTLEDNEAFSNIPFRELALSEILYVDFKMDQIFQMDEFMYKMFFAKNEKLINEVARLSEELLPTSDKEKRRIILHK